jgi:hypothetical protein
MISRPCDPEQNMSCALASHRRGVFVVQGCNITKCYTDLSTCSPAQPSPHGHAAPQQSSLILSVASLASTGPTALLCSMCKAAAPPHRRMCVHVRMSPHLSHSFTCAQSAAATAAIHVPTAAPCSWVTHRLAVCSMPCMVPATSSHQHSRLPTTYAHPQHLPVLVICSAQYPSPDLETCLTDVCLAYKTWRAALAGLPSPCQHSVGGGKRSSNSMPMLSQQPLDQA